jgi:hypothetical protein
MNPAIDNLTEFLPAFLAGMEVNFEIACIAILAGLAGGIPLALWRLHGGIGGKAAASIIGLMRAAPTFVVMFFLLNALPRDVSLMGQKLALSGVIIVALSLVPYSAAYIADAGMDAIRLLHRGSPLGGLLFLPNLARAFFVLVMSSGAAAAIGVTEGISVILRHAEALPALGSKLVLFAVGIIGYAVPLQIGFAAVGFIQRYLARTASQSLQNTRPAETSLLTKEPAAANRVR